MTLETLLALSVKHDTTADVQRLLDLGANPDFNNAKALTTAMFYGNSEMISSLASNKVSDVNILSVFDICQTYGLKDVAEILLKNMLKQDRKDLAAYLLKSSELKFSNELYDELFDIAVKINNNSFAVTLAYFYGVDIDRNSRSLIKSIVSDPNGDLENLSNYFHSEGNMFADIDDLINLATNEGVNTVLRIMKDKYCK